MNVEEESDIRTIAVGRSLWSFEWKEVWQYRYLLKFLVLRDIRLVYKQTILGPVHLFLRPIIMTLVFQIVFSKIGKIPTDGIHPFLFYFANNTVWAFYSGIFSTSSGAFMTGKGLMAKVFFPRIIPAFSSVLINAVQLGIQLLFFAVLFAFFVYNGNGKPPSVFLIGIILPLIQVACIALGLGMLFACITLRYRDLNTLAGVILQGMMYLSPIIYPFAAIPEKYQLLASFNPLSSVMESFRYFMFGEGSMDSQLMLIGGGVTLLIFVTGIVSFNVVQRKFIDIV